ncbi:MAG: SEC-C domain-containing protein [Bacteroidetes bacterium]|nr:SEC-C domain-containing protein [Bacteroidota bacterium]
MAKIGRNSPCPCGSGTKYKKCCLDMKKPDNRPARKIMPPKGINTT